MEKQADYYHAAASEAARESQSEKATSIRSVVNQPDELEFELASLVVPTEEEMNTLRHVPDRIDWSAYSQRFSAFLPLLPVRIALT